MSDTSGELGLPFTEVIEKRTRASLVVMVLTVWASIGEGRADPVKPRHIVMTDIGADPG